MTTDPTPPFSPFDEPSRPRLHDPGDLIAAVPHLMGYYPTDAVVINVVVDATIQVTMCSKLPVNAQSQHPIEQLTAMVARYPGAAVAGIVVGDGTPTGDTLPRKELVTQIRTVLAEHGVPSEMFWTAAITAGARWHDYDDPCHTGVVSDPNSSVLAVTAAVQGLHAFDSREDLAALLRPDPQDALARRAALIEQLPERPAGASYRLVLDQVARTVERSEALSDPDIAALAVALSDYMVRDACISTSAGDHARAAEQLWTELTRQCPAPHRAEPAALLAMSAYLRGNGVLASLALDRAQTAFPGHRLSGLLRTALDRSIHSDALLPLVRQATEQAERMVSDQSE
ncbi:DUF4192 domain-containing protein [Saccharothrix syringae]|uniref:DUF4192 domain-containing protein n=1 Tax=Saccharothrix syringae TaxID=103733 RepID=A0A5Q0H3T6_SACSY|nr:DUF4192 domain-containing protein [Saccharothrix syringae]QFZ20554.1 DUF4192 domain-containing protein [Saccharothrix syringae]